MTNRELLPAPKSAAEAMSLADMMSKSSIIPASFQGKPSDIFVAMMWSHTLGIPYIQGLQSIAVVSGRPTLYGDGALAVCMASGLVEDLKETITKDPAEGLTAVCEVKRKGLQTRTVRKFSQAEAQRAGLWGKKGTWSLYPKRMLQMRARAFALRDCFPDVLSGMGVYEEQSDIVEDVADVTEKSVRKMPRRKSAAPQIANDPTPSAAEVIPPAPIEGKTPAEVLAEVAEPAEEVAQAAEVTEDKDDPYGVEEEKATVKTKIAACKSISELMELYRTLPLAVRSDLTADFSARKTEIQKASE